MDYKTIANDGIVEEEIKKSRFIQKYITICLDSKMISLHLQHQTHI